MASGTTTDVITCFTCKIVDEYISLADGFTQSLMGALIHPMFILFVSLSGLWIVMAGFRLLTFRTTIGVIAKEFTMVIIAAVLLSQQGAQLINMIFTVTLQTMGAAASVALQIGGSTPKINADYTMIGGGLHALMLVSETAIMKVLKIGNLIAMDTTAFTPLTMIYALVLIVPYFILWVVYFAQVVVSIFRIMILAILSPFMILGLAFNWGQEMVKAGMRAVISSFIVLFASTAVMSILLYAVNGLGLDNMNGQTGNELASISNVQFMMTIAMGWLGTAFMTEATGLANSITGSNFTNNAAAVITAGAGGTALAALKAPGTDGLRGLAGKAVGGTAYGAGNLAGRVGGSVSDLVAKMKK